MERISHIADTTIKYSYVLLSILVPLILTPVNYELFEYNKMMVVYGITAVVVCAWVSKMIAQKRVFVRHTPFDIPIGLFVLSQFISTLFSIDRPVSWFGYYSRFNGGMLSIFSYVLLFYAYVSNIEKPFQRILLSYTFGSAIVVSIYGVLQHLGIDKHIWVQDVQARVFSTLGQPNWLAAYLVTLIPIGITLTTLLQKKKLYFLSLLATILFFTTLLFTKSRSGMVAFTLTEFLILLVIVFKKIDWKFIKTPVLTINILFFAALILFGTGIPKIDGYVTIGGLRQRMIKTQPQQEVAPQVTGPVLETGGTESGVIRSYVWQAALNAWRATGKNLLIGTGVETFAFAFYQYKPVGHNLTSEWDFLYNKAHNEYLNFLATTGIIGLGTYLFFLLAILVWFVKKITSYIYILIPKKGNKEGSLSPESFLFTGMAIGWSSLLVTNFFGFSVVVTQLLLFLIPAALIILTNTGSIKEWKYTLSKGYQTAKLVIVTGITIAILILLGVVWYADKTYATGYRYSRSGQVAKAYPFIRNAITFNRFVPLYHDEFGSVLSSLALAAYESEDATLAGTLAVYALTENDNALALSPNNVNFWKTKTKIYYTLATIDPLYLEKSIETLIHAKTLSPTDPKISYNLAILYGKAGDTTKALQYLEEAKTLKPDYRDAYYGLYLFYKETKQNQKANDVLSTYLQTINSQDKEFQQLLGQP